MFRYLEDPLAGSADAETYYQWREQRSFAFAFPTTPAGRLLVLLMGHRDEAGEARRDPDGYWLRKLAEHPGLAARVAGAPPGSKLRSTGTTPAFFRASSGPGWALAGDAGHFKDPVTGQGMRDAMFAGRTLAEEILAVLDDPAAVDRATRSWEAARDRECLPAYHFANADTRTERPSPALCELVREAGRTTTPDISDLFGRARTPQQIAPLGRLGRAFLSAIWRGERSRAETVTRGVADLRTELAIRLELRADRFRSTRLLGRFRAPRSAMAGAAGAVRAARRVRRTVQPSLPAPWPLSATRSPHDADRRGSARARARIGGAQPRAHGGPHPRRPS